MLLFWNWLRKSIYLVKLNPGVAARFLLPVAMETGPVQVEPLTGMQSRGEGLWMRSGGEKRISHYYREFVETLLLRRDLCSVNDKNKRTLCLTWTAGREGGYTRSFSDGDESVGEQRWCLWTLRGGTFVFTLTVRGVLSAAVFCVKLTDFYFLFFSRASCSMDRRRWRQNTCENQSVSRRKEEHPWKMMHHGFWSSKLWEWQHREAAETRRWRGAPLSSRGCLTPLFVDDTRTWRTWGTGRRCVLWCFFSISFLLSVLVSPARSVLSRHGSLWRRTVQPLWRHLSRGPCQRGQPAAGASRGTEDVQADDGPESQDHGHLQPHPRQTELPHR